MSNHDVLKYYDFFSQSIPPMRWLLYSTKTKVIYKSNRSARKLMAQFSLSSWSPQQEPHSFMTVMRLWYRVVECSVWAKRFKHLAKTMLSVWHFISQSGTTTFRLPGQAVGRTQCSRIRSANHALHTPLQVHLENQTNFSLKYSFLWHIFFLFSTRCGSSSMLSLVWLGNLWEWSNWNLP